jgi:hypothetical protein
MEKYGKYVGAVYSFSSQRPRDKRNDPISDE